jgi:hypothetical protein
MICIAKIKKISGQATSRRAISLKHFGDMRDGDDFGWQKWWFGRDIGRAD